MKAERSFFLQGLYPLPLFWTRAVMHSNPRPLARPQLGALQVTATPTLPGGHAGLTVKGRGPPQMPAASGGLGLLGPAAPRLV